VVMAKGGNVLSVIALIPVLAFNLNKTENVLTIQNMKIILTIQNTKIIVAFKLKQEWKCRISTTSYVNAVAVSILVWSWRVYSKCWWGAWQNGAANCAWNLETEKLDKADLKAMIVVIWLVNLLLQFVDNMIFVFWLIEDFVCSKFSVSKDDFCRR
jgi:hypothetical protein